MIVLGYCCNLVHIESSEGQAVCCYYKGANLKLACKIRVVYVMGTAANQLVEEKVGSKGRKKTCGSQKTPWWLDSNEEDLPCGGHQLFHILGVCMGMQEEVI